MSVIVGENQARPSVTPNKLPLCVDMDGSLLRIDTLQECAVQAVRRDWRVLFQLPIWLWSGRATLKRRLARSADLNVDTLPYNSELVDWLRAEKQAGRRLVLATAADSLIADAVAARIGLFDAVVASDGVTNLKAEAKAARLTELFGARGFAYVGNDAADVPVWARAGSAILVNASPSTARRARRACGVEREFPRSGEPVAAWMRALRLYQWTKNLLVFVVPLMAHQLSQADVAYRSLLMFVAFGLTASGIYLVNDISDLESDRRHPRKRLRPFASGRLPLSLGVLLGPILIVAGLVLAATLGVGCVAVLMGYAIGSIAYSVLLKTLPLVDVFTLAGLYTARIIGGAVASGFPASNWLLSASGFFFLGLAFLKRFIELTATAGPERRMLTRRGYYPEDAAVLQTMGISSGFIACLVLALYISSDTAMRNYVAPDVLWGIVPLSGFWICRLWLSGIRGYVHDDPIVYSARDWVSWCVAAATGIIAVLATVGLSR